MSGFADYERYDALGLADLVRRKEVSPLDLLEAAIERVEARNQAVNAVVMPLYDYGRKAIADGLPDGPFRGTAIVFSEASIMRTGEAQLPESRAVGAQLVGNQQLRCEALFLDRPGSGNYGMG